MTRRHRFIAAALASAALLAVGATGCGATTKEATPSEVSIGEEPATVEATTTTASGSNDTTTVPVATTGLASQEETVKRLYDAWFADDRRTAAEVADQTAIDGMWQTARGDYSLYNRCSTGEFDTSGCLYRGNLGTIQFTLERRGDFWVVIEAFYAEP